MAKLPEYEAPSRELAPSDKGASAFEQAGRRIGPAFNEAGTLTRQAGEAQADVIRSRKWPFDMLELTRSLDVWKQAEEKVTSENANKGVAFKVEGGGGGGGGGKGILSDPTDASGGKGHKSKRGSDVAGMSVAAAGLGGIAGQLAKGNGYRNSEIINGVDVLDPKVQAQIAKSRPVDTVLQDGQLLHIDRKTGQVLDKGKFDKEGNPVGPNSAAANAAQKYADEMANGVGKDPEFVKKFTDKFGYDPNTGFMRNRSDENGNMIGGMPGTRPGGGTSSDYSTNGYDQYGNPNYPLAPSHDETNTPNPLGGQSASGFWDRAAVADAPAFEAISNTISWVDRNLGSGATGTDRSSEAEFDPYTNESASGDYGGGGDRGATPTDPEGFANSTEAGM